MSNQESTYYVYALANPLKEGQYFYIGYTGREERLNEHLNCKKADKNHHKKNTIKKILNAGLIPNMVRLLENVTEKQAKDEEIRLIAHHGRADKGLGSLTNMTDGGEGNHGIRVDLSGQKVGRLTVVGHVGKTKQGASKWLCECECGTVKHVVGSGLKNGSIKSCGCLRAEIILETNTKHGMYKTYIYKFWSGMRNKCTNMNTPRYGDYGGRGIKFSEQWESFDNFYKDMGERPSEQHIIGRMDINGNFEISNCLWLLKDTQMNNRRNSHYLTIEGEKKTIAEWSRFSGTNTKTIQTRLKRKWSDIEAVFGKKGQSEDRPFN